jgi:circadian clock protein KaiB
MNIQTALKFRLYVSGDTPNSTRALANLKSFCLLHLAGSYEIEIVDVFKDPKRALEDHILLTPTLVRLFPPPLLRVIGSLNDVQPLLDLVDTKSKRT